MRSRFTISIFMLFLLCAGFTYAGEPVFVQTISTPDKSMNFIVGLYPDTYEWNDELSYSSMTLRVLNNADDALDWSDYWVYILLDDNTTLFRNYKTKAEDGEYANDYTVKSGKLHTQSVCFDKKFDSKSIKKVWVSVTTANFIELVYTSGSDSE